MAILAMIGFFGSWLLTSIIYGTVLKTMWGWFVVTTFQVPAVSLPVAIGLSATVSMMTSSQGRKKTDDESYTYLWLDGVFTSLTHSLLALIVGYICKSFM